MKTKEEIIEILKGEFYSVYCYNCEHNEDEDDPRCDDCHRKYMQWSISNRCAEQIADDILE